MLFRQVISSRFINQSNQFLVAKSSKHVFNVKDSLSALKGGFSIVGSNGIGSRRFLSDDLKSKFDKVVKENDVVVFMKGSKNSPMCGFSKAVVAILETEGVENFETVNVLADEHIRQGIKDYTSWPTIPQVFIQGEFIGGCDIIYEMHKNEELKKLLVEKKILEN